MHNKEAYLYEDVLYTEEQLPLFYALLKIKKETKVKMDIEVLEVFKNIFNNTPNALKPDLKGITKETLKEELSISRKICDDIISILVGAALIQYEEAHRDILWTCTKRGRQLAKYIKELNDRGQA